MTILSNPKLLCCAMLCGTLMIASCDNNRNMENNNNVFFQEFNTPYSTIPFDQIKLSDYLPAMREGIKRHDAEIEAIVNNQETPTFENTIVALERSGEFLSRVQYAFYNLLSAETCDKMDSIANEISPEETEHNNNVSLNEALFKRVKYVYDHRDSLTLTEEQKTLLKNTYDSFVDHGANLEGAARERYRELSQKLSLLELQ